MPEGTIARLVEDRGFGFIKPDNGGKDVFFHFSLLTDARPQLGLRLSFQEVTGDKGPRAVSLRVIPGSFLNPYNFVSHPSKKRPDNHVLGDCPPPTHDRYVGLTGRIICIGETETPLFISDSHAVEANPNKHLTYRFFEANGEKALPATSLRGMIRSVFEALTNSCFAVFQRDIPYPLEHRNPRTPKGMVPARVVGLDQNGARLELLDCTQAIPFGVPPQSRPILNAALVRKAYPPKVEDYVNPSGSQLPSGSEDGMRVAAEVEKEPVPHRKGSGGFWAFHTQRVVPVNEHSKLSENGGQTKIVFGWLHLTGPNIENKHDERLFFRWGDTNPDPPQEIPASCLCNCTAEVIEEYKYRLSEYWDRGHKRVEKLDDKRWPNSIEGLPHPSVFVEENRSLKEGDLVYAIRDTEGSVTMLRPVLIPRIRYTYTRQALLPDHLTACKLYDCLCPACRVFGWVRQEQKKAVDVDETTGDSVRLASGQRDEKTAYAGRVRFSHGTLIANKGELSRTLAILSTPKPTTTPFYMVNAQGQPDPNVNYDNREARLRGRKFYRHHGTANPEEYTSQDDSTDQNRTVKGALQPGATFRFSIDFENLARLELGALLYALDLEDGIFHRLGYAKPLGFGSVKVTVRKVETINWKARLESIERGAGWQLVDGDSIADLKKDFAREMNRIYGDDFSRLLTDLRALLARDSDLPIHYPRPQAKHDPDHSSFEWFVGNNRRVNKGEGIPLGLPQSDNGLPLIDRNGKIVDS
ncbi:MAG: TIGR03986 family CRISPR-associated RAMP protein [Peptococcaceae bacterium]|jgi:CRISPR-associated protein (TIGR03986 family)|nr:TIGR03986 family CRISPR-associated RAMP protein [Peptococcaceae bacterium]